VNPAPGHLQDLELARACLAGLPGAAEALTARFEPGLLRMLTGLCGDAALAGEIAQRTFIHALVPRSSGEGETKPALSGYSGKGSLQGWLHAVATRFAQDSLQDRTFRAEREGLSVLEPPTSRALSWTSAPDRRELTQAFEEATRALSARDRAVLRLNVVEALNIDEIGVLYGVHRATVARWISASKALLARNVRKSLVTRLGLRARELESLLRAADSELHLSLSRLLA
jgi:RNA polymerase sigma-70 factor (ECF subfamily)